MVTRRKGNKKFALFDLTVTLSWQGKWAMESKVRHRYMVICSRECMHAHHVNCSSSDSCLLQDVTGTIKITEFSSSSDPEEYCFCVTAEGSGQAQDNLKAAVEGLQEDMIKLLQQYVQELAAS